ncbi:MAG: hypothetical protein ABSH20_15150 [Tepidisphaeraceae bacterium]|jgi:ABC-type transporter Mla subunit MlaD
MATVSQPGSRGGLITALVIFVILFLISAIFAVKTNSELKVRETELGNFKKQFPKVVTEQELPSAIEQADKFNEGGTEKSSLYSLLLRQREDLARQITGQPSTTKEAIDAAARTVASANDGLKGAGVSVPGGALINGVAILADAINTREARIRELSTQAASLSDQIKQANDAGKQKADELEKAIAEANKKTEAETAKGTTYLTDTKTKIDGLEESLKKAVEDGRKAAEELTTQLKTVQAEIEKVKKENDRLVKKIGSLRPQNYANAILRQPAGKIIQIAKNNVVYIDLGFGQHVTQGLTFQIYDKLEGIPRIEGSAEELPPGKGSLEIIRVGVGSSECRIIKMNEGQQPQEGDIIANVIYNKNTQFHFKVYGDFDIDHNNIATAAETDVVKRLIVAWGAVLTDAIDIDTDFLVMGKEPVVPNYPKDQLDTDPVKKFEHENALKALKAYDDVRNKALELQIPVLNQNRFLYMIGYWDQGRK